MLLGELVVINDIIKPYYENNKAIGWWDNGQDNKLQKLVMVVGELIEAMEGVRRNLPDDKLPHRPSFEVELADALLRMLDIMGRYGWYYVGYDFNTIYIDQVIEHMDSDDHTPAGKLFLLIKTLTHLEENPDNGSFYSSAFIVGLFTIANYHKLDLMGAMYEKMEFNKTRPDHKLENRLSGEIGSKLF